MNPLQALPIQRFAPRLYRPGNLGTWSGHLPFASDLVTALRPGLLVELGTHYGESYFGFCQAVEESGVECRCFAVDTWQGDEHAGFYGEDVFREVNEYNQLNYAGFSTLIRSTFDLAHTQFANESIDLLHIDGLHTYAAVKHDFETWLPKVKAGGVVLMHDINVRHADFEVWRYWEELSRDYQHFSFLHWWGLGVLLKSGGRASLPDFLKLLLEADADRSEQIRDRYNDAADLLNFRQRSSPAQSAADPDRPYLQVFPGMPAVGFIEKESVVANLEGGVWQSHVVELAKGAPGGMIRIDPVNRPAWIEISTLSVRDKEGAAILNLDEAHLSVLGGLHQVMPIPSGGPACFFSWGNDPQIVFELPPGAGTLAPLNLELTMRVSFSLEKVRDELLADQVSARPAGSQAELEGLKSAHQQMQARAAALQGQIRLLQTERVNSSAERTQLKAELSEWRAHATGLRATITREESVRTRLEWDLTFSKTQIADRERRIWNLEDLNRRFLDLQTEADLLQHEVGVKDAVVLNLQNLAAAQEARVESLTESLSWRITGPLRMIAGSFLRE